jgi:hypothetical protein
MTEAPSLIGMALRLQSRGAIPAALQNVQQIMTAGVKKTTGRTSTREAAPWPELTNPLPYT